MIEPGIVLAVGSILVSGGAAYGGVKVALNGTRQRVQNLERAAELAAEARTEMGERMARVETKIDVLAEKIDNL